MSTIVRIYSNNKRVATGKPWKDQFLQVYPVVKAFASEEEWKAAYEIRTVKVTKAAKDDSDSWSDSLCTEDYDSLDWQPVEIPAKYKVSLGATMEYLETLAASPASAPPPAKKGPSPKKPAQKAKKPEVWTHDKDAYTLDLPAGTYYIGDPWYSMTDDVRNDVFGKGPFKDGLYKKGNSFALLGHSREIGQLKATDGKKYFISSACISIFSTDLIDQKSQCLKFGALKTFKEPVSCKFRNGVFLFESGEQSFFIDT